MGRWAICLPALLCLGALAGCGGGSGTAAVKGEYGRIVGRAVDDPASRAPAAGLTVSVDGTEASATPAADGSFRLERVPAGLRTLVARSPRRAVAVVVDVRGGGEVNVGALLLRDAGQISGLVTDSVTGEPIPGARVTVAEAVAVVSSDMQPRPVRGARTDGVGSYTVSGLPVGGYLLTIAAHGYAARSLALEVRAGATTPGDAALEPGEAGPRGAMAGTAYLVTPDGGKQPLAGVLVRLAAADDPVPMRPLPATALGPDGATVGLYPGGPGADRELYTFTDENGAYRIEGAPAGEYVAAAVRPGLVADSRNVAIVEGRTAQVDFALRLREPRVGAVQGTVTDASTGRPIAGATVSVRLDMPPPPPTATGGGQSEPGFYLDGDHFDMAAITDAEGRFQLRAPGGEQTLIVEAGGYEPVATPVKVEAGATVRADIALQPGGGDLPPPPPDGS